MRYIEKRRLYSAYEKESKNTNFSKRIHAVILVKCMGNSPYAAAELLGCTFQSVYNWLKRYEEKGINGLKDRPKSGRPPKISKKTIGNIMKGIKYILSKNLQHIIWEKTGEKYCLHSIRRILHKYKFRLKKVRRYYRNRATPEKVKEFQEETIPYLKSVLRRDIPVFVADQSHAYLEDYTKTKVWARIGKQIDIPYQNYHRSIKYFGALGTNNRMLVREYHSFTAEYFIECLSEMFKKYGRFVILVDGASSHHAESVKEFCDEKGIKLIFLPVGRPELSAIEKIWLDLKKELVYGHFYENSEEFKIKAACFFRRKFKKYDLMEYLQKDVVA